MDMKRTCQKYFIPHAGNNYHPHILHTKRAFFYGAFFVAMKLIVVILALALPLEVFVLPDVLAQEQKEIMTLTNSVRTSQGLKALAIQPDLISSAQAKAEDMATNEYFSHTSPSGRTVRDFVRQAGYKYSVAGENLAMGFTTAEQVVEAWKQSPTHYANLIDKDFVDFGVGLESGVYAGETVVYVAEHLASPSALLAAAEKKSVTKKSWNLVTAKPMAEKTTAVESIIQPAAASTVLAEKEIAQTPSMPKNIIFVRDESKVYWQEVAGGGTVFSVRAKITGPVEGAVVLIGNRKIELKPAGESFYQGELAAAEPADNFFRVVVPPVIKITAANGAIIEDNIDWYNIKTVGPTPVEQYVRAQGAFSGWMKIFNVTRDLYLIFIGIFSLALALSVFIQIKKQHPHVIVQTLGLIGLLACLAII